MPASLPSPSFAEGEGHPKLDSRTFPDGARNRATSGEVVVNFYDHGGGLVEGVAFIARPARKGGKRCARPVADAKRRDENEVRAANRAKAKVRRLVLASGLTHLLTLTTRKIITDPLVMWDLWSRFTRLVRPVIPVWDYVAVAEFQKRGALHLHAAVKGYQDVGLLRRKWLRVLADANLGDGAANVRPPKGRSRVKVAQYLAKYIAGAVEAGVRDFGGHRYRASRGLSCQPQRIGCGTWRDLRTALEDVFGSVGAAIWAAVKIEGVGAIWACSWDRQGRPSIPPTSRDARSASRDV